MDPTLCPVWITVTRESRRPKMKKPLQKCRAVLRCCRCNWSLLPYHWGYQWLNRYYLRGPWWLLLCCHLCELLTYFRHLLVLPRTLEHRSRPLLHDIQRGRGRKPLLLLLLPSLLQRNALRQRVPRLLELLGLSVNRHVLGCNRPIRLELLMIHQLTSLSASAWRH
ncbi:hypothetical protein Taro_019881, partial [Colocasia esculenta]|nr:hypothetical protein [Colocasia esculenta]